MKKGLTLSAASLSALALLALAGCNRTESATPEVDVQKGIDRSVADVRAAQAAASAPVAESRSVGELTRTDGGKAAKAAAGA